MKGKKRAVMRKMRKPRSREALRSVRIKRAQREKMMTATCIRAVASCARDTAKTVAVKLSPTTATAKSMTAVTTAVVTLLTRHSQKAPAAVAST